MRKILNTLAASALAAALTACGDNNTASNVAAPGAPESAKTKVLEAGAVALQNKPPVEALNAYLDGFHFYNGRMKVQMEAHHYCAILNEDLIQCVIYDGNQKEAKLMGVEYDPTMVVARDQRFGIDSNAKRKDREDIAAPPIAPGADAWQQGTVVQITDPTGSQHAHEAASRGAETKAPDVNARSNKP